MAMFGALGRKKPPFDFSPEIYQAPGIGDGMTGVTPMGDPGLGISAPPAPAKRPGASFAGILADALAGAAGMPATYAPMVQRRREQERQDQRYQRRLGDQRDQWLFQQNWERKNPKPVNNDTRADYEYISGILGRDAATQWLKNKTDPVVSIPVPGGTYLGPRSRLGSVTKGGGQSSGGPAIGAVEDGYRFKGGDPSKPESWEPAGGPTQPASGGFR